MNSQKQTPIGTGGPQEGQISQTQIYKAIGFDDDDLSRPIIGIANAFSEIVPGHAHLRQVADFVKKGVYRAGGTAVEFGVIGCCDGVANGHSGMHYVLPSREVIADSIEIMAKAHKLDGIVLLCACDKIVPGPCWAVPLLAKRQRRTERQSQKRWACIRPARPGGRMC